MEIKDARIDGGKPFDWAHGSGLRPVSRSIPRNCTVRSWIAA